MTEPVNLDPIKAHLVAEVERLRARAYTPSNDIKGHVRVETHYMSQTEFCCKHCSVRLDFHGNPLYKWADDTCWLPTDMALELMVHLRRRGFKCRARRRKITIEKPYLLEVTVTGTWEYMLQQVYELPKNKE